MPNASNPKVILITGCSSGFGLLTAARLASLGHTVVATMRNLEKKDALLKEVTQRGGKIELLQLDVTDQTSIDNTVKQTLNRFKTIDVVVNNAGYGIGGFFEDLSEAEIRAQLDTNFFGVQNVCRAVLPVMRQNRSGKIITISSVAGLHSTPGLGAYNASKWALEGFLESLYFELKLFGIQVCMIEPGTYPTTIFRENKRLAKNFTNPESPYYSYSRFLDARVNKFVSNLKKDQEDIAGMVEDLINVANPPLRNFPDKESLIRHFLKRFLPFRLYGWLVQKAMFWGYK